MYQHTVIIGNLGDDPKMRYTPSGDAVADFSVAVNRKWKNADGETQEKTTWFRVTAWRKLAEICNQYLAKGRLVLVEGEVSASSWVTQNGEARATLELNARNVRFLGKGNGNGVEPETHEGQEPIVAVVPDLAEADLPF
jgi:single-strand DNA-binding protein